MNSEVLSRTFTNPAAAMSTIMDGLPVGVAAFRGTNLCYVNSTFLQMVEKSETEIREAGPEGLFDSSGETFVSTLGKIHSGELLEEIWETGFTTATGRECTYKVFVSRIDLDNDKAILVTLRDMTQQKKAEREAREQGELFRLIGENSGDFIYVHDPRSKLSYVSPGVENITGYPADDWDQHSGRYLVAGPKRERAVELTYKALKTGE